MFNTYIYGTPLGFDFYEDDVSLKDYFKGLYISSRKGRRLMVNRRNNGVTIYNYLIYGLAEKGGRLNSFFGMSISMDNDTYAYDFKEIFDWFDYLFEKLLSRGTLFRVNAGNVIQYQITKFKDNSEEIQWLKNNIPNLFTRTHGAKLLVYDSSFSSTSTGQIRCFNTDTPESKVSEAFKNCHWVALSPNFKPEEEAVEIDITGIKDQLNVFTRQLVPIAISPRRENLSVLSSIKNQCFDTLGLTQKYIASSRDETDRNECAGIMSLANDIMTNAQAIIKKINDKGNAGTETDSTLSANRICQKCGQSLPPNLFEHNHSAFCLNCSNTLRESNIPKRKCTKCGIKKPVADFPEKGKICRECNSNKNIWELLDPKLIAFGIVLVLIFFVIIFFFTHSYSEELAKSDCVQDTIEVSVTNMFNAQEFNTYLKEKRFKDAYELAKGTDSYSEAIGKLRASIENHLWNSIRNGEQSPLRFFEDNPNLTNELQINNDVWNGYATTYSKLTSLLNKDTWEKKDKTEAKHLAESLPFSDESKQYLISKIENKPVSEKALGNSTQEEQSKSSTTSETPSIKLIANNDTIIITESRNFEYGSGTRVEIISKTKISYNDGNISQKRRKENHKQGLVNLSSDGKTLTIDVLFGDTTTVNIGNIKIKTTGKFTNI